MIKIGITEQGDAGLYFDEVIQNIKKKKVDAAILITKAPHLLLDKIDIIKKYNIIIHCTITGLVNNIYSEILEPNVFSTYRTIPAYEILIDELGIERVVLRIDPIIPCYPFINNAYDVILQTNYLNKNKQQRIRISFLDNYKHINKRLQYLYQQDSDKVSHDMIADLNNIFNRLYRGKLHALYSMRKATYNLLAFTYGGHFEICSEPDFECTGCISLKDYEVFGFDKSTKIKYSKQRTLCKCILPKVELLNYKKRCEHNCLYCYWK